MKLTKLLPIVLLLAIPVHAQGVKTTPITRAGVTATVGTEAGLGYTLPYYAFGAALEHTIGSRSEVQFSTDISPTDKEFTHDGTQLHLSARGMYWLSYRAAITGEVRESFLWTNQINKRATFPVVGMASRFYWLGIPQRAYIGYIIPTGSRPTDGSLQSNRLQGPTFTIEGQGWERVRISTTFNVLTFLDQSGSAPGHRNWTGTLVVTFRFGTKQDPSRLY